MHLSIVAENWIFFQPVMLKNILKPIFAIIDIMEIVLWITIEQTVHKEWSVLLSSIEKKIINALIN